MGLRPLDQEINAPLSGSCAFHEDGAGVKHGGQGLGLSYLMALGCFHDTATQSYVILNMLPNHLMIRFSHLLNNDNSTYLIEL